MHRKKTASDQVTPRQRVTMPGSLLWMLLCLVPLAHCLAAEPQVVYLGDARIHTPLEHQQQWGSFGLNTAASAVGQQGSPLRIGDQVFARGLGHHANGEITVDLAGQYEEFRATLGVHWQGGGKGSVVFRVEVDGKVAFESKPRGDSDDALEICIPLSGAQQLKLIAGDAGDGIGCDMANWAEARLLRAPGVPFIGAATARLAGRDDGPVSNSCCDLAVAALDTGPQLAVATNTGCWMALAPGETAQLAIPLNMVSQGITVTAEAIVVGSGTAEVALGADQHAPIWQRVTQQQPRQLSLQIEEPADALTIACCARGVDPNSCVRWTQFKLQAGDAQMSMPLSLAQGEEVYPPPELPALRPALEQLLIEWDWRMQDGIGTARLPQTWSRAVDRVLRGGDQLLDDLRHRTALPASLVSRWRSLRSGYDELCAAGDERDSAWEPLWREVHQVRRQLAMANPLLDFDSLLFAKRVPSCFSHQLTQYYGMCARPGGGIFVLEEPGRSMRCRQLTSLPPGSYQHPELSWDGRRVLFSYCRAESAPVSRSAHQDRHFHLYEISADGTQQRQLTDGPYDDFAPRYLADDRLLFLSTRRGGYHRCGAGPCPVYTLATANADGSDPRSISYHETHEWDPALLNDGRIIYTRWDYVDRNAVYYQQLWSCRPDGTNVTAYFGNNTFNPVGVWEARPIPNSNRIMATAGAHHAMTAGSIIMLDVSQGIDGLEPITRLTPDALFPESEAPVQRWHATASPHRVTEVPEAAQRWPGHCYRTPYPLSADYFLAAYSFDPLIGEPSANKANMFGIYLVDRFGNKELLYRDLNIGSLWPLPLRPRQRPPVLPSQSFDTAAGYGTFFLHNVYDSWPRLPAGEQDRIHRLRVLQVLPKTTPHINAPKVGLANASPGKQVLGTVPVEPDGSAYFRAPAKVALAFQALDERGMAVQTMRSLTYLQPGEQTSCVGCHEHRSTTPPAQGALALQRPPSEIEPGPEGSKPLSFPLLVQNMLNEKCVSCHGRADPAGGVQLTGDAQGAFSASYLALAPLVAFSQWNGAPAQNLEPTTAPNQFGARASKLTQLLLAGHEDVTLTPHQWEQLITWMDANALFYGTFNPQDQQRQLLGERIAGPDLE